MCGYSDQDNVPALIRRCLFESIKLASEIAFTNVIRYTPVTTISFEQLPVTVAIFWVTFRPQLVLKLRFLARLMKKLSQKHFPNFNFGFKFWKINIQICITETAEKWVNCSVSCKCVHLQRLLWLPGHGVTSQARADMVVGRICRWNAITCNSALYFEK